MSLKRTNSAIDAPLMPAHFGTVDL